MRKGFDSLAGIVTQQMSMNALSTHIFIFINKKRNQIKLLLWEGDGFSLYHKRLEKGTYELPPSTAETSVLTIDAVQLQLILQGISLKRIHYRTRYKHAASSL